MDERQKETLKIVAVIIAVAIILWLLLRQIGGAAGDTVIQETGAGDSVYFGGGVAPYESEGFNLPALYYEGSNYIGGSRGCVMCFNRTVRLTTPTVAAPAPAPIPPAVIINYMQQAPAVYDDSPIRVWGKAF